MSEKLEYTKQLVKEAGQIIRTMMKDHVEVSEKTSHRDLVTNVDKAIEVFLVENISSKFENQSFLTEEKTVETIETDDMWVIDPIDGTSNFIFQRDNFAISVALYHKRMPVFGIVYDVIGDKLYSGEIGAGAYLNDVLLDNLDQETELIEVIVSGDVYHPDLFNLSPKELKPRFLTNRFLGSGALETAMVGASRFGAYVFPRIKLWDIAAGVIILECVGGTWTFGEHEDSVPFDDKSRVFIGAQNNRIKDALVALL